MNSTSDAQINQKQLVENQPEKDRDFGKLCRVLSESLMGHCDLFALFALISLKSAWGDFEQKFRGIRYHAFARQFYTSVSELSRFLGQERRKISKNIEILVEMGILTKTKISPYCICLTISQKTAKIKSVSEATEALSPSITQKKESVLSNTDIPITQKKESVLPNTDSKIKSVLPNTDLEKYLCSPTQIPDSLLYKKEKGKEINTEEKTPSPSNFSFGEHEHIDRGPRTRDLIFEAVMIKWLKINPSLDGEIMKNKIEEAESKGLALADLEKTIGMVNEGRDEYLKDVFFRRPQDMHRPDRNGNTAFKMAVAKYLKKKI